MACFFHIHISYPLHYFDRNHFHAVVCTFNSSTNTQITSQKMLFLMYSWKRKQKSNFLQLIPPGCHFSITKVSTSNLIMWLRIGIRSEDLQDFAERTFKGSTFALSSPRLVFPAVIYGFWALFHQHFMNDIFDFQVRMICFGTLSLLLNCEFPENSFAWCLRKSFCFFISFYWQLAPAMLGLFAYKAAALVQVYRDNEDLQFIFPDTSEN